jgi:peptidoglycan/xylan/chitin deacetylase (PgdA/CDA1 family)
MSFRSKISTAVLILLLHFPVSGVSPTGGYGQVSVKKWADDRKSAFTFTFDDGFMSQYNYAAPILDSCRFKGTFFLISGSMTDFLPPIWRYGTWNQFRSMALDGHEIGSHTVRHYNLTTLATGDTTTDSTLLYELYQSKKTIEQKISNQKCITIAYPYNSNNTNVRNETALFYESGRGGSNIPMDSTLADSGFYKIGAKEEQFNTPRNSTLDDLDELQNFETYEDSSIANGKWGMLMAHEVVPFSQIADLLQQGSWFPMSTEWLTSLCQWLKQRSDNNEVWVETMGNITRYMKEREQFQYNITIQTDTQIQINATDNLNDLIYNYPLTVDITVPPDWESAFVIQGSRKDSVYTIFAGNNAFVRTKIIPDGGILILNKRVKPTGIVEGNSAPRIFSLEQNYPNPFNPSTRIKYSIPLESNVRVTVFNTLGEEVRELTNKMQEAGTYEISFNSLGISSGVYFYSIVANSIDGKQSFRETKKMVLLK